MKSHTSRITNKKTQSHITIAFKKSTPISFGCRHNLPPGPGFPQGGVFTHSKANKVIIMYDDLML